MMNTTNTKSRRTRILLTVGAAQLAAASIAAATVTPAIALFAERQTTNVVNNTGTTVYLDKVRGQFRTLTIAHDATVAPINDKTNPGMRASHSTKASPPTRSQASKTPSECKHHHHQPLVGTRLAKSRVITTDESTCAWSPKPDRED